MITPLPHLFNSHPLTLIRHILRTKKDSQAAINSLAVFILANPIGFEPTIFAFGGQRSIQLNYGFIPIYFSNSPSECQAALSMVRKISAIRSLYFSMGFGCLMSSFTKTSVRPISFPFNT